MVYTVTYNMLGAESILANRPDFIRTVPIFDLKNL